MNKEITVLSHSRLESISSELLAIKDQLRPLKAVERVTTQDIKLILGSELRLGVGEYSVGASHLSCSLVQRTDIKAFTEGLGQMGVERLLIEQAMEAAQIPSDRLVVSKSDEAPAQKGLATNLIPGAIAA